MKVVEDVRRERLMQLKKRFGTFSALNEKLQRPSRDATLSQIANASPDSKTGKPRVMGSPQARLIEKKLGLEVGWMDTDPVFDSVAPQLSDAALRMARELDASPEPIRRQLLQIWAAACEMSGKQTAHPEGAEHADPPPNEVGGVAFSPRPR